MKSVVSEDKWVYQIKNGKFYKRGERSSWLLGSKPYKEKDITTSSVAKASLFDAPSNGPPDLLKFMEDGQWIPVKIIKSYNWGF